MDYLNETKEEVDAKAKLSLLLKRLKDNTCAGNITWSDTPEGFVTVVEGVHIMMLHPTHHGRTVPMWFDDNGVTDYTSILSIDGFCVTFPVPNSLYTIVYNKHMAKMAREFCLKAGEKADTVIDNLPDVEKLLFERGAGRQ